MATGKFSPEVEAALSKLDAQTQAEYVQLKSTQLVYRVAGLCCGLVPLGGLAMTFAPPLIGFGLALGMSGIVSIPLGLYFMFAAITKRVQAKKIVAPPEEAESISPYEVDPYGIDAMMGKLAQPLKPGENQ